MSSLNILLICRDAKTKDAKVRISLHLYFFIREYHRQTRHLKKKSLLAGLGKGEFRTIPEGYKKI